MKIIRIVIFFVILLLSWVIFGKKHKLYSADVRPDGNYKVEVYEIISTFDWLGESGYHDALILVKDRKGKVLRKMYESPAIMTPVSWEKKGILVGGAYYAYGE